MNRIAANPEVRTALLDKARECQMELSGARRDLGAEPMAEAMDKAVGTARREAAAERIEHCSRILQQVGAALSRLEGGSYGICLRCEEAIGQKRLDALPWAPFCVECQEGVDLLHALVGARRRDM